MKKALFILFLFILVTHLFAQEETLTGNGIESGGYGGPVWKVGLFNGKAGFLSGGRGGWIINHTFVIGGGGYSLITDIETDHTGDTGKARYLDMEYGGLELEYINRSDRLIHWTIHAMIGSGQAKLKEHDPIDVIENDRFFVIEPSFNIDINIAKWFRIGFGASYIIAAGVKLEEVSSSDLSGPTGLIILKFGAF
jgi:hypothetical protein